MAFVEPGVPGGLPATTTMVSPGFEAMTALWMLWPGCTVSLAARVGTAKAHNNSAAGRVGVEKRIVNLFL